MELNAFPYVEQALSHHLGVSREELHRLRTSLVEGADWILKKKRIRVSESGLKKLRDLLGLPQPHFPPAAPQETNVSLEPTLEKTAPPANAAQDTALKDVVTLLVWKTVKNTRILEAYKPGTDPKVRSNILRVRVRDSKNFVRFFHEKPMELKARHIDADLYELASACPRWRGRY